MRRCGGDVEEMRSTRGGDKENMRRRLEDVRRWEGGDWEEEHSF